jgi:hypothetical protein
MAQEVTGKQLLISHLSPDRLSCNRYGTISGTERPEHKVNNLHLTMKENRVDL